MVTTPHHIPKHHFPIQKLITRALYCLLPLAILHLYFFPLPFNKTTLPPPPQLPISTVSISPRQDDTISLAADKTATKPTNIPSIQQTIPSFQEGEESTTKLKPYSQCDYSAGRWVPNPNQPLYNSSCSTIKPGQNCAAHGRPDTGYLHWRWQPAACSLPPFSSVNFLQLIQNKHLAFVGDSIARNQFESLLCLLSAASPPALVFTSGEDNKFRRYSFPAFNATVSIFWSPFLVSGVEKGTDSIHNKLFLDTPEATWVAELEKIDMVVFSAGHWFLHPAVFYVNGAVIGCHHCPMVNAQMNYTETGFFDVFRMAVRTAIDVAGLKVKRVVVTTFSPAHFEGEWDKAGACRRTEPYEGERAMTYMDNEMRKAGVEEVAAAAERGGGGLRIAAVDVTRIATMRPDGHPGPYMNPDPFAGGVKERVQNDCVHWCLPGPIDTWNEVLLAVMRVLFILFNCCMVFGFSFLSYTMEICGELEVGYV